MAAALAVVALAVGTVFFIPAAHAGSGPFTYKLKLYEQDYSGKINLNGAQGTLKFSSNQPSFKFAFAGTGLAPDTQYSLIRSREPGITLPYRCDVIGSGTANAYGNLSFSGSYQFNMTLISARILLVPANVIGPRQPDGAWSLLPQTSFPKCLFGQESITYNYTGAPSPLLGGVNMRPPGIAFDDLGPKAADPAIDFTLMGIDPSQPLEAGNRSQPLVKYQLSELYAAKPVVLVFGAFT